jgi:hypothetical protein
MLRIFALAILTVVWLGACAAPNGESIDSKQLTNVTVYKSPT